MDTAERIVEAYVRYVKHWATIPNIRCRKQSEIDLLAVDPASGAKYHVEVSVSISGEFSKLTGKPYDQEAAKDRVKAPSQRRTVGFFAQRKFAADDVLDALTQHGFVAGEYTKVIVTWDWTPDAQAQAVEAGIELWSFQHIMGEIAGTLQGRTAHFGDDTLRTLHLYALAEKE